MADTETEEPNRPTNVPPAVVIVLVGAALFGGVLLAKYQNRPPAAPLSTSNGASVIAPAQSGASANTSARNDAAADYETALKTGKPIYVLFRSLS